MRKIILLSLIVLSNFSNAQTKTIVPKSGTVVFISKDSIYDKNKYENSLKELDIEFKKQLRENFIAESTENGQPVDTVKLNFLISMSANVSDFVKKGNSSISKIEHEYKNDTIIRTYENNGLRSIGFIIDVNKNHDPIITKGRDSNAMVEMTSDYLNTYTYSRNKIESIKEDRKKIRKINGYDCFKVIYTFSEPKSPHFNFPNTSITTRELWVTERIKSPFHPIINEKDIVVKYYPLEIVEYSNMEKGKVTLHKVERMDIN